MGWDSIQGLFGGDSSHLVPQVPAELQQYHASSRSVTISDRSAAISFGPVMAIQRGPAPEWNELLLLLE